MKCLGCADSILVLPHQCGGMIHPGCRTDLLAVMCSCRLCHPSPGGQTATVSADARRRRVQRRRI